MKLVLPGAVGCKHPSHLARGALARIAWWFSGRTHGSVFYAVQGA